MAGRVRRSWRKGTWLLVAAAVATGAYAALQWPVRTRQGVNFHVEEHRLPLYLKLARFLYRDMEYRALVRHVIAGVTDDQEKMLRLYAWVRAHIWRGVPEGIPVVDDHVWHIIVRGYGTSDQLADVLATLCVYAGIPAQLAFLGPPGQRPMYAIAMVKLGERWCPVDPYNGVLVRHPDGSLASREDILGDAELVRQAAAGLTVRGVEYTHLYQWLPEIKAGTELRPYWHQPLMRVWYEVRRGVRGVLTAF